MFRGKKSVLLSHKFVQCWTKCGLEAIVLKMSDSFYDPLLCAKEFLLTSLFSRCVHYDIGEGVAPHSSALAWKIPWMEEPGRLWSTGSLRVGHHWATSLSLFTFTHWRRRWQPTPVFLPGESQGRGSLVGCRLWGRTESDATEAT